MFYVSTSYCKKQKDSNLFESPVLHLARRKLHRGLRVGLHLTGEAARNIFQMGFGVYHMFCKLPNASQLFYRVMIIPRRNRSCKLALLRRQSDHASQALQANPTGSQLGSPRRTGDTSLLKLLHRVLADRYGH